MSRVRSTCAAGSELPQTKRPFPPKYVPNELIGAFNAITSCVRLPNIRRIQVVHAQSASAVPALPALERPRRFETDLDFKARLSILAWGICILLPPFVFWLFAATTQGTLKPDTVVQRLLKSLCQFARDSWLRWTWTLVKFVSIVLCSAASSVLLRYHLREKQYAQRQHPREQLADTDSLFKNAQGISVHCKQASPAQPTQQVPSDGSATEEGGFFRIFSRRKSASRAADGEPSLAGSATAVAAATAAIALYHGFGANLWSWGKVQQQLADATGSPVVAHDMPGFGLTERPAAQSAYTLQTNGDIGRQLAAEALAGGADSGKDGSADSPQAALTSADGDGDGSARAARGRRKAVVLVGHSLGAAGVASSFVQHPEGVAGIVLVAPAIIVSPFSVSPKLRRRAIISDESSHRLLEEYDLHAGNGSATTAQDLSADEQAWHARSVVGAALQRIKGVLVPLMFWAIRPALFVVLRGVVRMKSFWERGLKSSYFDTSKLSGDIVYYYRLPQLLKGWELGISRFLQARFMADENWKSKDDVPQAQSPGAEYVTNGTSLLSRFERCVKDTHVPVLIMHGEQDTLVPIGNSCRLSAVIQAPLIKISGCGHTPAEELPDMFVDEVARFVQECVCRDGRPAELDRERSQAGGK